MSINARKEVVNLIGLINMLRRIVASGSIQQTKIMRATFN